MTAAPLAAVMSFLILASACSKEKHETVDVAFDPETTYTMRTTDVSTLISDSGVTRYRANAKVWEMFAKAKDPYWYFPEKLYLEQFDSLFNVRASIQADTAYYYEKRELWEGIGNVELRNIDGERFSTSLIYWNQKTERIYSDKFIRIQQHDKIITGIGFDSNQSLTEYRIFNTTGIFPFSETSSDQ
jgi:LPS export ABC transporter protein LptC